MFLLRRPRGTPTENAFADSFQRRMRECLNEHLLFSINHARTIVAGSVKGFNTAALGDRVRRNPEPATYDSGDPRMKHGVTSELGTLEPGAAAS